METGKIRALLNKFRKAADPKGERMRRIKADILRTVRAALAGGQYCNISYSQYTIEVHHSADEEYFFQDEEAAQMLREYEPFADEIGLEVEDVILWVSQGW